MIQLIRDHNGLNGIRFSVIEFLLAAVLLLAYGVWITGAARAAG